MPKKADITIKEFTSELPEGMTEEQLEEALRPGRQAFIRLIVNSHIQDYQDKEEGLDAGIT